MARENRRTSTDMSFDEFKRLHDEQKRRQAQKMGMPAQRPAPVVAAPAAKPAPKKRVRPRPAPVETTDWTQMDDAAEGDVESRRERRLKNAMAAAQAAVEKPELVPAAVEAYGEKIAVGIDAQKGTVRTRGWVEDSGLPYLDFARKMEGCGVRTIIFTDIDRDGLQKGPSFAYLQALREAVGCEIVASGGVTTLEDVVRLRDMGIDAAIVGKAAYTGAMDLRRAVELAGLGR